MPDPDLNALARGILGAADTRIKQLGNEWGVTQTPLTNRPPNIFDGFSHLAGDADAFATGYASGTGATTMPFTTDISILYGDGVSGDILTGS